MTGFLRHLWPPGIRIQLMLWYVVIFSVLLFLFGSIVYVNLRASLTKNFDETLQFRTQQIAAGFKGESNTITLQDIQDVLPWLIDTDDAQNTKEPQETHIDADLGAWMRFINAGGQTVYATPDFRTLNAPAISATQALHGTAWLGTVTVHNGQTIRLYSVPLFEHGSVFGVVEVGTSLASLDSTLQSVILEFLVAMPFVLLFCIFGSYWIATRAFMPITRLIQVARRIKTGDLHQRVPVPRTKDEVQNLALIFNEMIEYIEKSFTRQRRFVADASHELRTPVAAIGSMTEVALAHSASSEASASSEEKEYISVLRMVNTESERLRDLISDLLTLAQAEEGKIVLEREQVRLDLLAADVAVTVEPLANERNIILEVQAQEPVTVLGDEARLIQVIMNLIDNAIAYTDAGGQVTLSVEVKGATAFLTVRDTGTGIEPEHLGHIFERFYRTDPARSRVSGGNGLGLAIVDWVVRTHGGTISVESRVGQGSTFVVTLPQATRTSA